MYMVTNVIAGADSHRLLSSLEGAGKATAGISGILLIFSVFYDYNYLLALGLSFSDIPTTIADHVRSAIVWLPRLVLDICSTAIFLIFLRTVGLDLTPRLHLNNENGAEAELPEQRGEGQTPVFGRVTLILLRAMIGVIWIGIVIGAIILGLNDLSKLYAAFIVIWSGAILLTGLNRIKASMVTAGLAPYFWPILLVPLYLAYVGARGYLEGSELMMLTSHGRQISLVQQNGDKIRTCKVLGMRRFGDTVILVGRGNGVAVMPAERILVVRKQPIAMPGLEELCQ
jgi:hypothetical protein